MCVCACVCAGTRMCVCECRTYFCIGDILSAHHLGVHFYWIVSDFVYI